jgi:hypothetical protein
VSFTGIYYKHLASERNMFRSSIGVRLNTAFDPGSEGDSESKPAILNADKNAGRKSQCEPLTEVILAKAEVGLSAQRIYQDLVEENGFGDSYESVKRFVRKLQATRPELIYRNNSRFRADADCY